MTARRLTGFVYLTDPETGEVVGFGPDSTVPEWASAQITNPAAWETVDDATPSPAASTDATPSPEPASTGEGKPDDDLDSDDEEDLDPGTDEDEDDLEDDDADEGEESSALNRPRVNARPEVWAEYAASLGIGVPENATRDQIKALIEAASN